MRKFFGIIAALMLTISLHAQTALETSKVLDNMSVGVEVGAITPLTFNSVFPLNTVAGLKIQKDLTPVVGLQIEGLAIFNSNNGTFVAPSKTFVKATNVGLNGVLNLSNLIGGYKGTPRTLEVSAVAGLGWLHEFIDRDNSLTAKTGLDLAWNLGNKKAVSLVLTPAIWWNLNKTGQIKFDKRLAQIGLTATAVYHFKTSNGTHAFVLHDIGALNGEINNLRAELAKKPKVIEKIVEKTVEVASINAPVTVQNEWVVQFAQGKSELSKIAKDLLNTIPEGTTVTIVGTASPEGTEAFNQTLSTERAQVVADFLTNKGVTVLNAEGKGVVDGITTNRLAIVKIAQ